MTFNTLFSYYIDVYPMVMTQGQWHWKGSNVQMKRNIFLAKWKKTKLCRLYNVEEIAIIALILSERFVTAYPFTACRKTNAERAKAYFVNIGKESYHVKGDGKNGNVKCCFCGWIQPSMIVCTCVCANCEEKRERKKKKRREVWQGGVDERTGVTMLEEPG